MSGGPLLQDMSKTVIAVAAGGLAPLPGATLHHGDAPHDGVSDMNRRFLALDFRRA